MKTWRSTSNRDAVNAISSARLFARNFLNSAMLGRFHCPPGSLLYQEAKQAAFSPASEARLAAALCAQVDVWTGALGAVTHARRAIANSSEQLGPHASRVESDWLVGRLLRWLSVPEPFDWSVG
jgi:hypothetical protein